jgi:hypothetical protein
LFYRAGRARSAFTDRISHYGARRAAADRIGSLGTQLALKTSWLIGIDSHSTNLVGESVGVIEIADTGVETRFAA